MRFRLLGFAFVALLCGVYVASELRLRTSIVDFLPEDQQSELLRLARDLSTAPQSRGVVLTLSAKSDERHRKAARVLAEALRKSGTVRWVRGGLVQGDQEAFYQLFFPSRLGLVELSADRSGRLPDEVLTKRVAALRARLSSPLGALVRETAPQDPLGLFDEFVQRQAGSEGQLTQVDGQLVTRDGRWSVVFAETKASAFDASSQTRFARKLTEELTALRKDCPSLVLEWSSVGRFSGAVEESIRNDIGRVSSLSLLGIILLYIVVFRSLRESVLVLLPIAFGSVVAVAVCQLSFGFVHGLSLAFGSSIIGAAEDFSTHFFAHRLETSPSEDNESLMRRLWPGMLLGGLTSVVGVLSLLASGFPGLVQMAVFGAVGILSALACTRYVLPSLSRLPERARKPGKARSSVLSLLSRRPLWATPLWVVPSLLMLLGLPRLQFQDGVAALRTRTPTLDAENARVQARLGRSGAAGKVILATGADDEEALRRAEQVAERLASAGGQTAGEYRSVVRLLPSVQTQLRRTALLRDDATLLPRLSRTLAEQGFVADAFAPFETVVSERPTPVTPEQLLRSPLSSLVASFRMQLDGRVAYLTPVTGGQSEGLSRLLSGLSGVYYVDQERLFSAAFSRFRERALSLLLWGLGLVLFTLLARYRKPALALLGILPAVLGAGAALGVIGLLGVPVSFMNVVAVLLVLSMGVDYGIYALEGGASEDEAATTLGSVLLAALTTVLSFGLLGVSDNPALASIGSTVGLGLLFCVLTSPLVLVFSRRGSR